jgi:TDG/mug DNA glycosylase family protein
VRASDLGRQEFANGVATLWEILKRYQPRTACFHGLPMYRRVLRKLRSVTSKPELGLQPLRIGVTRCFVVPNPSGANAHFTREEQTRWYDRLADEL